MPSVTKQKADVEVATARAISMLCGYQGFHVGNYPLDPDVWAVRYWDPRRKVSIRHWMADIDPDMTDFARYSLANMAIHAMQDPDLQEPEG